MPISVASVSCLHPLRTANDTSFQVVGISGGYDVPLPVWTPRHDDAKEASTIGLPIHSVRIAPAPNDHATGVERLRDFFGRDAMKGKVLLIFVVPNQLPERHVRPMTSAPVGHCHTQIPNAQGYRSGCVRDSESSNRCTSG